MRANANPNSREAGAGGMQSLTVVMQLHILTGENSKCDHFYVRFWIACTMMVGP